MPDYDLNDDALARAKKLIDDGDFDDRTEWSDAAPSADEGNAEIDAHGWEGYAAWHLAVDPEAGEQTKKRYHFPYGDFSKVNRAALIHGKQRASQNGHDQIERAFDDLLRRLDAKR
ncbi:hypothetical protein SAMN04515665_1178 [Blastococcus sp. DSM 46786]|uniref:hypothetical protein n=1 Tax=Blastococcus sp. DSM 46786 TaxID=1798227 RepID=UPI0008C74FB8|nr:hypothetical protein [Blastococcus sp. DSM 46786]SEL68583.1 hypothetical protein SAMN04515665_1178 [Blastococcus sp. DSM 46786]